MNHDSSIASKITEEFELRGFCQQCNRIHSLPMNSTRELSYGLMKWLEINGRINFFSPDLIDKQYSTKELFGPQRGKMFGVMEALDQTLQPIVLYAFSGQYNGNWLIHGWAPPLFDVERWDSINTPGEKEIKRISRQIDDPSTPTNQIHELKRRRKTLSQVLMKKLHSLYTIVNFNGNRSTLMDLFSSFGGIPTGTGDCCGPKLLNYAIINNLVPVGIAEFYWGKDNKSGTRQHGAFYSSCHDKCSPLLGFMLCGLDEKKNQLKIRK